jgi:adenosylmethionine-8-amino-7-oxononanoate aminotransferase
LIFDSSRSALELPTGAEAREKARHSVRHFLADFRKLEASFPGDYPRLIVRAEGAHVWDVEGRRLLDAGGHLGACQVGHGRREIGERIARQVAELDFIALDSGLSHPKAVELAEVLAELVPVEDPILSFTTSGSESNELAIKLARAYHSRRGEGGRTLVLSRDGSYHGSSFGGMSATGAPAFQAGFGPLVPGFRQVAQPSPGRCGRCLPHEGCTLRCADALEETIAEVGPEHVAAVIAEPVAILQAVKVPHAEYWSRVQSIARAAGALLIADEVVTGFGRTGRMFGSEHWGIQPDILTMAKGITSGYVPLGAVAVARQVEEAFTEPLLHLNTYAGHPVACEAALANIEILRRERLPERAARLEPVLRSALEAFAARSPRAVRVSAIGLLSSVEVAVDGHESPDELVLRVRHAMYENGVIARCSRAGDVLSVVFYPALVVEEQDLVDGVAGVADALESSLG